MPTPSSGAISMNNMRSEITRATSSALSMSEIRTRYDGSGAISFNSLYKVEGFTITTADAGIKFVTFRGMDRRGQAFGTNFGSVSPDEANGVQVAANSYIGAIYGDAGVSNVTIYFQASSTGTGVTGITSGFQGTSVSRVVTANTNRSLGSSSTNFVDFVYTLPATTTIHCLVKF